MGNSQVLDSCGIQETAPEKESAAVELPRFEVRKNTYKLF